MVINQKFKLISIGVLIAIAGLYFGVKFAAGGGEARLPDKTLTSTPVMVARAITQSIMPQAGPTQTPALAGTDAALAFTETPTTLSAVHTPSPSSTPSLLPSPTFTSSPLPTKAAPVPTQTPKIACNSANVNIPQETSVPDGADIQSGQSFTRFWRIQNSGSCTWTSAYAFVWVSGDSMGAPEVVPLGLAVAPGESFEVSLPMRAPGASGDYRSEWMLRSDTGELFGLGVQAEDPFVMQIHVVPITSPTPTQTGVPSATPALGSIEGKMTLNGSPVESGVQLRLEDQSNEEVAQAVTDSNGAFIFSGIEPSTQGYNLVFTLSDNQQFSIEQVLSWAWIGPIPINNGDTVQIADFEISLLGFGQVDPEPDASISAGTISPGSPVVFRWNPYPDATGYWVDLTSGEAQVPVWKSPLTGSTQVNFDGTANDGTNIQPGEYWWGIGARTNLGGYKLTIYGFLSGLIIEP